MGQQQYMLIALCVLIAGIGIMVGIQMASSGAEEDNIDQTSVELLQIISKAREYYAKPQAIGGGGKSFTGFQIPGAMDTTENAYYSILRSTAQQMILVGSCRTAEGVTITALIYPTDHRMVIYRPPRGWPGC